MSRCPGVASLATKIDDSLKLIYALGMTAHRFLFDQSALHGQNFDRFKASPLKQLCLDGKLEALYAHVFLEETLNMWGNERRRSVLQEQIAFLLDLGEMSFFRDRMQIWEDELVLDQKKHARKFYSAKENKFMVTALQTGVTPEAWADTAHERDDIYSKKQNQRQTFRELRDELPKRLKENGHSTNFSNYSFAQYCESDLEYVGRSLIQSQLDVKNVRPILNRWAKHMELYPYVTAFVKGFAYATYYAALHQNDPIDQNAQADYLLMTHLNDADILVSADTSFLKQAFIELWEPQGKKLYTPEEFLNFMNTLSSGE